MLDFDAMLFGHQRIAKIFHLFIQFVMKSVYGPAKVWLNKIILGGKKKTEQKRRAISRMNCPNKTPKPFCSWIYLASVFFGIPQSIDVWGDKKTCSQCSTHFFPS
jgi:hypothetical protein